MSEDPTPADDAVPPVTPSSGDGASDRNGTAVGTWARVVELDRQVRFLSAKCDELRHSCRELLAVVVPPGPLTEEQVHSIQADPPRRSREEVYAEYSRLREEAAVGTATPPPGPFAHRIADLERQVGSLTARREELRVAFLALLDQVAPSEPPTDEELWDMLHGPRGRPLIEIIEGLERELNVRLPTLHSHAQVSAQA